VYRWALIGTTPMADVHAFLRHWGLDEAAGAALLQLSPAARSRVLADFAPKAGTRDVNRLFYGFLRSVQNVGLNGPTPGFIDDAGFGTFTGDDGFSGPLVEDVPPAAWQAGAVVADVEAFLSHWGLDTAACELLLGQPPHVQARVMTEFAPKPGTRDVKRLFQGFMKSVLTTSAPPATNQGFASARHEIGFPPTPSQAMPTQPSSTTSAENPMNNVWGWTRPPPSHGKNNGLPHVHAFIRHWGLDASSQTALLQLDPAVQARVLVGFEPKAGTRDVNRLLQGFIKSVQTAPAPMQASRESTAHVGACRGQLGPSLRRRVLSSGDRMNACHRATRSPSSASTATASESSHIQSFVDNWGLDAESVAALVQLDIASQMRVTGEFAPKANTQDVNRLFRGFIRSIVSSGSMFPQREMPTAVYQLNSESCSDAGDSVAPDVKQWARTRARATHTSTEAPTKTKPAAKRSLLPKRRDTTDQVATGCGTMAMPVEPPSEEEWDPAIEGNAYGIPTILPMESQLEANSDGAPSPEELVSFVTIWGLGDEDLLTLEGQPPDVQQRVLEHFSPKPGTRDVKSLFHGFMKSVAQGRGVKRPR